MLARHTVKCTVLSRVVWFYLYVCVAKQNVKAAVCGTCTGGQWR